MVPDEGLVYVTRQTSAGVSLRRFLGLLKVATAIALCMAVSVLSAYADDASPDGSLRSKKWEVLLSPQYTLSKDLGFDGGTTAKINDTWGFGLQFGYNFNEHWNLGGIFSWNNADYQAVVQPAAGNSSPPRSISGTVETTTFALAATYNVLASVVPVAGARVTYAFARQTSAMSIS